MGTKKWVWWSISLIILILIGSVWYLGVKDRAGAEQETDEATNPVPNYPIHWHPQLTIIIDGVQQPIPANIGLNPGAHAPVHTHETNGTIHVENNYPSKNNMRLGYFFDVWKKTFSENCIFDYCADKGTLTMTVNGIENTLFDDYIMADGDIMVITYTSFAD